MHRSLGLGLTLASAAALFAGVFACGNLIIPNNDPDAGDDASEDALGSGGDDVSIDARPPPDCDAGVEPVALACTGLYSDWTQLTLAPDVQAYTPGATMWADGASSSRWIWLPPGSKITTTDPNNWVFPVGTKIWQEFDLLGKKVETRFLWKEDAQDWFRTTFVWSEDQSAAPAETLGVPNAMGLSYGIPPVSECGQCHSGAVDFVLGFEQVSLGLPKASGLTLQVLEQQQMLSNNPTATATVPGTDDNTISSLIWLHANCGTSCHNANPDANGASTGMYMKLLVDSTGALPATEQQTQTWTTSYMVPSSLTPYGYDAGSFWRLSPGDPAHSAILWTASQRNSPAQMPPIGSYLVDENDVATLSAWITSLPK